MILSARMQFLMNRLRERLWVKPMIACVLSVAGVALAHLVDSIPIDWKVSEIAQGSIVDLLKVIAASMLGVATFAVASMVAAYVSAGQSATERAFPLVIADDVSQNALSIFVGAFIFAIIGLSATTNDYFGKPGRFTLFVLTLLTLVIVVLVFVRWVDSIARLGRLGAVIARVERAAAEAMARRTRLPCMGGMVAFGPPAGLAFHSQASGYLQRVDMDALQRIAAERKLRITLAVAPGALIVCSRPIGYVLPDGEDAGTIEPDLIAKAFTIGPLRQFDEDPGFGLVVLTEIGSRALSAGINDPGTCQCAVAGAAAADATGTAARLAVLSSRSSSGSRSGIIRNALSAYSPAKIQMIPATPSDALKMATMAGPTQVDAPAPRLSTDSAAARFFGTRSGISADRGTKPPSVMPYIAPNSAAM